MKKILTILLILALVISPAFAQRELDWEGRTFHDTSYGSKEYISLENQYQNLIKEREVYCNRCEIDLIKEQNQTRIQTRNQVKLFGVWDIEILKEYVLDDEGNITDEAQNFNYLLYYLKLTREIDETN